MRRRILENDAWKRTHATERKASDDTYSHSESFQNDVLISSSGSSTIENRNFGGESKQQFVHRRAETQREAVALNNSISRPQDVVNLASSAPSGRGGASFTKISLTDHGSSASKARPGFHTYTQTSGSSRSELCTGDIVSTESWKHVRDSNGHALKQTNFAGRKVLIVAHDQAMISNISMEFLSEVFSYSRDVTRCCLLVVNCTHVNTYIYA
jgi:hypothetical protein